MTVDIVEGNPAEIVAEEVLARVYDCIQQRKSFRLEAGAGAGKTYTLVKVLGFIIDEKAHELLRRNQNVACITYTNVATDEITARIDGHPAVRASTIHAFCWNLIKPFQVTLRDQIFEINGWAEKIEEVGGIGARRINYDLGHRNISESELSLGHDDVLALTVILMEERKFRNIFTARFPILLIDEYQDTNTEIAHSLIKHFIATGDGPLIGFFGDSWQKIYGDGCGLLEHENLEVIGKGANFRSVKLLVDVFNKLRPDLTQCVQDPESQGFVAVYHSNDWPAGRRTGSHWAGDLLESDARVCLQKARERLEGEGWDFSPEKTKILLLTHNALAGEQGYSELAQVFRYNDSFIKKESKYISFLVDVIEPVCVAYQEKHYGEMFAVLGQRNVVVKSIEDKISWARDMDCLIGLRAGGTIGEVIEHLKTVKRPRVSASVNRLEVALAKASSEEIGESRVFQEIQKMKMIPYQQIVLLAKYLNKHTPFSTKHGVKGAEFENVLVVLGRGWNHYNWNQFIEWFPDQFPANKMKTYERNRNLFYVACSRPKVRLALLFTQELSDSSLGTLIDWFGAEAVGSILS